MFSRFQRFYTSMKVFSDVVVLALAFGLAYLTRFHGPLAVMFPPQDGVVPSSFDTWVSLACVLVTSCMGLVGWLRTSTRLKTIMNLCKSCITMPDVNAKAMKDR